LFFCRVVKIRESIRTKRNVPVFIQELFIFGQFSIILPHQRKIVAIIRTCWCPMNFYRVIHLALRYMLSDVIQ